MKRRPLSTAIAISVGLILLISAFVPALGALRQELLQWAILLASVAVLVGLANLFSVHYQKTQRREKGWGGSLVLLIAMLLSLAVGLFTGSTSVWTQALVETVIFPVEASLMALLAVTLLYASIRLLRRRAGLMSIVFLGTAALMLAASVSLPAMGQLPILSDWIRPWLMYSPAVGGARGLLIGVALGSITTGLRVLLGFDRPYGGK